MRFYCRIKNLLNSRRTVGVVIIYLYCSLLAYSQETNTQIAGIVKSEKKEILANATVTIIHESTQNTYHTLTNEAGLFYFFNIKPGGPYTILISYAGYDLFKKSNLYFNFSVADLNLVLHENLFSEFNLKLRTDTLPVINVRGKRLNFKTGIETDIQNVQLLSLPSITRNLQDFVRMVPQASIKSDGGISLAGQNSKYNAFFIDGANTNDLLGLAPSGINGGQTASPPLSIEAIEEINVMLAPYDVQYSNFTGGSLNIITKSGSNNFNASAWYYFRNEKMAGKSPQPIPVSSAPEIFKRQRLSPFFNQTAGALVSGPVFKNKLFYFLLLEKQKENLPQPYNFSDYKGASSSATLAAFADTLKKRYGYDPGSFLETNNNLEATRLSFKMDWNPSGKNKITLSYRYNNAERINAQSPNTGTLIRFSNNLYKQLAKTNTLSLELKTFFNANYSNRLLITYTHHMDDRNIIGDPFPQVIIADGPAMIFAGSNGTAHLNYFKGLDISILNLSRFIINKQVITAGVDIDFTKLTDVALNSFFGNYRFSNFAGFFSNGYPARFSRTVSLVDEPNSEKTNAGAIFTSRRQSFFVNNDIRVTTALKLTMGIRLDGNVLPKSFTVDSFFTKVARPEIEKYYDLEGASLGQMMKTHWQLSPRVGFTYTNTKKQLVLRGGAGLFTGHIINLWSSAFYNVNTYTLNLSPQQNNFKFNPNPYQQPGLEMLSTYPSAGRGDISIVAKKFKYPVIFRTSLSAEKSLQRGWTVSTEFLFTKNIYEHSYTNVNLLPPVKQSALPDKRNIYSLTMDPPLIPMPGSNPYGNIILMTNNKNKKGYAWSMTAAANKNINNKWMVTAAYTFGKSVSVFEPNGASNNSLGQWFVLETVNGKNYAERATSDFDPGHRLFASITKNFTYAKDKMATFITLFYNGQSGTPFSYVYAGKMINDNAGDNQNSGISDLIYIPTRQDLQGMVFIPVTYAGVMYTAEQQKSLLNNFIEADKYLRKHRGQFAERNGARLPSTHIVDIRVQQSFYVVKKGKKIKISIMYDIFNVTNLINKRWGKIYTLGTNVFPLINFMGFANQNLLIPQYQFIPFTGNVYSLTTSTMPGSSARWISQVGVKVDF